MKNDSDVALGTIRDSSVQTGKPAPVEAATGEQRAATKGNEKEGNTVLRSAARTTQMEGGMCGRKDLQTLSPRTERSQKGK